MQNKSLFYGMRIPQMLSSEKILGTHLSILVVYEECRALL